MPPAAAQPKLSTAQPKLSTATRPLHLPSNAGRQTPQPPRPATAAAAVLQRAPASSAAARPAPAPPRAAAPSGVGVVQCSFGRVSVERVDTNSPYSLAFKEAVRNLQDAVDRAYRYVVSNPTLGALADLDGHTRLWVRKWRKFMETGNSTLMAADFGYAIESVATHKGSTLKAKPPTGMDFMLQGERGATRPDVILTRIGLLGKVEEIGWLDITAENSAEHIFTQKEGWRDRLNVAEIVYPSTPMEAIKGMTSLGTGLDLDSQDMFRQMAFQRFFTEYVRNIFREQGEALFGGVKLPRADASIRDQIRRAWTIRRLKKLSALSGLTLGEQEATNILYTMGRNPKTYGFTGSVSMSTGEHLLKLYQQVPQLTAPREFVPMPFGPQEPFVFNPGLFNSNSTALVPVTAPTRPDTRGGGLMSRLKQQPGASKALERVGKGRRAPLGNALEGLSQVFRRMSGRSGFSVNNLVHLMQSSGLSVEVIRSCKMVVSDTRGETYSLIYSPTRGFKMRRLPNALRQRGERSLTGSSSLPTLPSSSPPTALALLNMPDTGGQLVTFNPSQTLHLLAFEAETEDNEKISGVNDNGMNF